MEKPKGRILLVEDDPLFYEGVKLHLKKFSVTLDWAKDAQEALNYLKTYPDYAVAIIDQHLSNEIKGDELAHTIRNLYPDLQIIYATGDLTQETLTELLKTGIAMAFIPKGRTSQEIIEPILKALSIYEKEKRILKREEPSQLEAEQKLFSVGIVGRSKALLKILEQKEAYKRLPASTLIVGESGTGKEVIAQAFAKDINEILPINCSTYLDRENLMDSELFGHVRGAFTGADKDKSGIFEIAKGRIIFLDEIHHLSISAQAKLLRVLQEKKIVRVGDHSGHTIACNFHIIAAGKPELLEMMKNGEFLPDLYYRIATYSVKIPPLSERKEDIEPLAEYFAKELRHKTKIQKHFRASTIRLMENYSWTGEVRELRNIVEQIFGESKGEIIEPSDFLSALEKKFHVKNSAPSHEPLPVDHQLYMTAIETNFITGILSQCVTQKEAAEKMNLGKSTLNNRLKILGINPDNWLRNDLKNRRLQTDLEVI